MVCEQPSLLDEIRIQGDRLVRAEDEMRELTNAFIKSFDGSARLDLLGHYVHVDDSYARTFGRHVEDFIGRPWSDWIQPSYHRLLDESIISAQATGNTVFEVRAVRRQTENFWIRISLVRVPPIETGRCCVGYYAFIRDLTNEYSFLKELLEDPSAPKPL